MSCSLCGEVCRCVPDARPAEDRWVGIGATGGVSEVMNATWEELGSVRAQVPEAEPAQEALLTAEDAGSWRKEVSERLSRYHARRRPRPPRYPSLRLKFDTPETRWVPTVHDASAPSPGSQVASQAAPVMRQAVAVDYVEPVSEPTPEHDTLQREVPPPVPERRRNESTGKLIEFPRTIYTAPVWANDLAEPMLDRPRILEAPEIVPPPPALGGMTIEEVAKPEPERRPGIDMPLQSAPAVQRCLAGAIDGVLVLTAGAVFGGIFYRVAKIMPTPAQMAAVGSGLLILCWAAYQYLLVVYSGSTPGLRALRLRIRRFDGNATSRKLRRARVLCALLSAISLGLGYAWHFLDEDGLCWHDRVTKTHIAP